MKLRLALTLFLVLLGGAALSQSRLMDGPADQASMDFCKTMMNHGILQGYPDDAPLYRRPPSKWEIAVAIHAASMRALELRVSASETGKPTSVSELKLLRKNSAEIMQLDHFVGLYALYLGKLDVDVPKLLKDLQAVQNWLVPRMQFSDVPKNHWAADAVANLAALKVLNGYPDAKFRG